METEGDKDGKEVEKQIRSWAILNGIPVAILYKPFLGFDCLTD
jgi:hypothetical protein